MSNFDAQWAQMIERVEHELEGFAAYAETLTREESKQHWEDDSGSARDSITAYVSGNDDHDKNFNSERWREAQTPGYQSPIWGNEAGNFVPSVNEVDPDGEITVALTMFVPYAEALEEGSSGKFNAAGSPFMQMPLRPQRQTRVPGLLGNMTENLQDDFANAVAQAFQSALG